MAYGSFVMGTATAFFAALICGFVAAACVFKFALNLLTVAAGKSMNLFPDAGEGRYWEWPRDRFKIVAQSTALAVGAVLFLGLTYVLAGQAFGHVPHLTDGWIR